MRYLLDTNITIFLFSEDYDNISNDVKNIVEDYHNILYVSSLSLVEIKYLFEKGKLKKLKFKSTEQIFDFIQNHLGLKIIHTKDEYTKTYANLSVVEEKTDLIDRFIISQAITEKMPLISSDRAFENYTPQKLKFVYNKR
ncbi:type II toxin-antitoxin system VapC family toxin [Capnocytophaga canis]|uniref:type II toxin-antitoxin system VapC family toxin n=1 Tax=Capnocytophaga canis TaxID=1848903 RepID=UPI001562331D|nr:PIN domain-containing protein [Capnocytophaga canis]